jgi:hypothetical protein
MTTARLILATQYRENYGAHDWNGEGECPQYWKNKGGIDYHVADVTVEEAMRGEAYLQGLADAARPLVERSDDYAQVYVLGWSLYWPGELTSDEQDAKEYGYGDGSPTDIRQAVREAVAA